MDRPVRTLLLTLAAVTAARIVFAASFPLLDDEAYYWTWAQHPAWGYPDHPPMIAFVIRATTALVGDSPLGVRLGPILLALGISLLLFDLARRLVGAQAGVVAALWFQLIPVLAAGAVFTAPDEPFGFFWMLTLWWLWRARTTGRILDWAGTGAALGLAMLSKLAAVFLALAVVGFLVTSPEDRRWLRRPHPYVAAVVAIALIIPMVLWNVGHDWAMVVKSAAPAPWVELGSPLRQLLLYSVVQLGYYGLLVCPLLIAALVTTVRGPVRRDPRQQLIAWASIPIVGLTWIASLSGIAKPHWPAPGYLVALIPAAALWIVLRAHRHWRIVATAAVAFNLVIVAALHGAPFLPNSDVAGQIWGWDQVARQLTRVVDDTPGNPNPFVLTWSYQSASQLQFHSHERFEIVTPQLNAFSVRRSPAAFIGANGIFIDDTSAPMEASLARIFQRVEQLPSIEVTRRGQVVRRFQLYRGYGFRGFLPE